MVYHVMVIFSVLDRSAIDRGFETRSGQTKDYKIGICCFSAKHAALRRENKDWLARNQDNVSEWGDMSTHGLLFQCASIIKIQLSVLFLYKADLIIFPLKINLLSPWHSWKIAELALNNNHSLTIEVYAPSQKCAQSCVCVTGVDFTFFYNFSIKFLLVFILFQTCLFDHIIFPLCLDIFYKSMLCPRRYWWVTYNGTTFSFYLLIVIIF
jgi:hypothetical protein